jgi:FtsP/CotA-like multicopper oxidase with cupredoxin domain
MRTYASMLLVLLPACTTAPPAEAPVCATPADATAAADITLTASDAAIAPTPDVSFVAWTIGGDVPGPILRIPLGETRTIKLVNASPRAVSLRFHGLTVAADENAAVDPGCAHVTTVTASQPGVWPYHGDLDAPTELSRGLYGAVIVPDPTEPPVDHELVAILGALGMEPTGAAPVSGDGDPGEGGSSAPSFFQAINGRPDGAGALIELVGSAYVVTRDVMATTKVGDRVRLRIANLSTTAHPLELTGHPVDGLAFPPLAGGSVEFGEWNAGSWLLRDPVIPEMFSYYNVIQ